MLPWAHPALRLYLLAKLLLRLHHALALCGPEQAGTGAAEALRRLHTKGAQADPVPRRRTEELDLVVAHGQLLLPDDPRRVRLRSQQRGLQQLQRRARLAVRHLGAVARCRGVNTGWQGASAAEKDRALASSRSTERSWFFRLAFFTFFLAEATVAPLRDAVEAPGVAPGARIGEGRRRREVSMLDGRTIEQYARCRSNSSFRAPSGTVWQSPSWRPVQRPNS